MSGLVKLLSGLPNVRGKSPNYRAGCRSCGGSNPSKVAIRELPDGRILLHCFGGCEVGEILDSLGMSIEDLFPERLGPVEGLKRERRPAFSPRDALLCLSFEALIISIAASDLAAGKVLSNGDRERLLVASGRINSARALCDA